MEYILSCVGGSDLRISSVEDVLDTWVENWGWVPYLVATGPDVQIQNQLIYSNPLNCTRSLEVLYSIFTNIWLSGGRHINIRSYLYSGCSSFPVWYSSGFIGWRCMCWPLNHCLKIVRDLLDMSFSPSKMKISIWRKFEVINKKVTWIHPRLTEWFKIDIGGILIFTNTWLRGVRHINIRS